MTSKYLVKSDENERLSIPVSKRVAEEKKDLEKRAEALGFKIPYNEEVEKVIAKINKQVAKGLADHDEGDAGSQNPNSSQPESTPGHEEGKNYNTVQS